MDSDDVVTEFLEHGTVDRRPGRLMPEQLDLVADPILIVDNDRKYVDVNQAAAKLLGRTRETIIGRSIGDHFSRADDQPILDGWQKFIAGGEQCGTVKLKDSPGSIFAYRSKANFKPGLHISVLRRIQ